jgi:hypothetical protein
MVALTILQALGNTMVYQQLDWIVIIAQVQIINEESNVASS